MFRETDGQGSLLEPMTLLSKSQRSRLEQSWAEPFREKVLPLLLDVEDSFADLYAEGGRPNYSVARLLGIFLLQQMHRLTDQEALDAFSFDRRWQHAFGVSTDDAYVSRRTLVDFRKRVTKGGEDRLRVVFDAVFEAAATDLAVSTSQQRLDSTLVTTAIRVRGRISLARETIRVFIRSLTAMQRRRLPEAILGWYESLEKSGWEPDIAPDEQVSTLHALGQWVRTLLEAFADDADVSKSEPYGLLQRLATEHASELGLDESPEDPPPNGSSSRRRKLDPDKGPRKKNKKRRKSKRRQRSKATARYWSPADPDASFGHKGLGYHVHLAETCRNERTELITHYGVVTAAISDVGQAKPVVDALRDAGRAPDALYADGGYSTPDHVCELPAQGTDFITPVDRGPLPTEVMSRHHFDIGIDGLVRACPEGHPATRHGERAGRRAKPPSLHAFFDADTCRTCPKLERCPVRGPNNGRSKEFRLDLARALIARDERWEEQKTDAFVEDYNIRQGIEATCSEMKRAHGLGHLPYRGMPKVIFAVALKSTACNIKRWLRQSSPASSSPPRTAQVLALPLPRAERDATALPNAA